MHKLPSVFKIHFSNMARNRKQCQFLEATIMGKLLLFKQVFNKNRPLKHTLKTKQNGHVLKSVQTSCEKNECITKHKPGTRLLETKIGKNHENSISTKDSSKEFCNKDHAFITEKDNTTAKSDNTGISVKKPLTSNKKFKKHPVSEDLRDNLVCLTQEQLEQILKAVKEGTKTVSQLPVEKKKETSKMFIIFQKQNCFLAILL